MAICGSIVEFAGKALQARDDGVRNEWQSAERAVHVQACDAIADWLRYSIRNRRLAVEHRCPPTPHSNLRAERAASHQEGRGPTRHDRTTNAQVHAMEMPIR